MAGFGVLHRNEASGALSGLTILAEEKERGVRERKQREEKEGDQVSLLAILVTVFRKSLIACKSSRIEEFSSSSSSSSMEIGLPTNVRHVAHVTFDRFNGFLGLPVEFEPEVPRRPPSASSSISCVYSTFCIIQFRLRDFVRPHKALALAWHAAGFGLAALAVAWHVASLGLGRACYWSWPWLGMLLALAWLPWLWHGMLLDLALARHSAGFGLATSAVAWDAAGLGLGIHAALVWLPCSWHGMLLALALAWHATSFGLAALSVACNATGLALAWHAVGFGLSALAMYGIFVADRLSMAFTPPWPWHAMLLALAWLPCSWHALLLALALAWHAAGFGLAALAVAWHATGLGLGMACYRLWHGCHGRGMAYCWPWPWP
ncbi:Rho GTPase-activating protein 1 [Camellia lanceoleosa]|uniref:Rho GTPase-activating protein 1 n=1 Tax=Camellia lanceoleosa TaxID=1840588 RepID=A0ACC0FRA0_9ERIC|nr:Rho GTPase-activating protein 1 [Camellia lanceoleosa]